MGFLPFSDADLSFKILETTGAARSGAAVAGYGAVKSGFLEEPEPLLFCCAPLARLLRPSAPPLLLRFGAPPCSLGALSKAALLPFPIEKDDLRT